MSDENLFVVVDTETTGLGRSDRVIEIAAVTIDLDKGEVVDEFDSLINPMRDISNSNIHGISAEHVSAAPTFQEAAIAIANVLEGSILVAHNIGFDRRMISDEFTRLGANFDGGVGIDTRSIANEKLEQACRRFGITIDQQHRALSDARATAQLFLKAYEPNRATSRVEILDLSADCGSRTLRRGNSTGIFDSPTIRRHRPLLFPSSLPAEVGYLDKVDYFLEDLHISEQEWADLQSLASDFGIHDERIYELHSAYLMSLVNAALRDGFISDREQELINRVSSALRIADFKVPESAQPLPDFAAESEFPLRVCLTGSFVVHGEEVSKTALEAQLASLGFQPVQSVTKKGCDLVIAANPASMSGKAQKARDYNLPVRSVEDIPGLVDGVLRNW